MNNSLAYYPVYNTYPMIDSLISDPDASTGGDDVFAPGPSSTMTTSSQIPLTLPMASAISPLKRKTIDTDASYSPASTYSENSNYSDPPYPTYFHPSKYSSTASTMSTSGNIITTNHLTTSPEDGSSDDEPTESDDVARKREKHTFVEAQRRALEKAHFRELSTLIASRNDPKVNKLHHLDLLKIAAEQITEMNARHRHDPLRPSNLTENELNFLTIEASNSFLFVALIDSPIPSFRLVHITESIRRILKFTPQQWLGQNLFSLIHPDDVIRVQNDLLSQHQSSRRPGVKSHIDCRMKQGNNTNTNGENYVPVVIDGITKIIDRSLPVLNNTSGTLAFIAVCHLPLIAKYVETNNHLYRDPQSLTFRCRCSPNDWKIFLVDRSFSTLPSLIFDNFRQKSILEFVHLSEQAHVHQALVHSITTRSIERVPCHFVYPLYQSLVPMTLEIRAFFNPVLHRPDFLELTFTNLTNTANRITTASTVEETKMPISYLDFAAGAVEIDDLLRSESTTEKTIGQSNLALSSPTGDGLEDLFSDWIPKNEPY